MPGIVIICGPTACGKSAVSINLAQLIGGEIISADSMQIYKYMDIGTAKVTNAEMAGIPHYLIDELYPNDEYNIAVFKNRAAELITDIQSRSKVPIICGGTGFYINALLYNLDFDKNHDKNAEYRREMEAIAHCEGAARLHEMLREVDLAAAEAIDVNNVKRIIRALEYYKVHGAPISQHNAAQLEKRAKPAYNAKVVVLHAARHLLYERINRRVDEMAANGLIAEVASLLDMGYSADLVSLQGLGYKEIAKYINGEYDLETALNAVKQGTRRFAKRQITWFKHQLPGAIWLDIDDFAGASDIAATIQKSCENDLAIGQKLL